MYLDILGYLDTWILMRLKDHGMQHHFETTRRLAHVFGSYGSASSSFLMVDTGVLAAGVFQSARAIGHKAGGTGCLRSPGPIC
jgi:hypothetical protein